MQWLKSVYAMRFHRRHLTLGHLFKRPYDSRPILTEEHLHRSCGYTLQQPGQPRLRRARRGLGVEQLPHVGAPRSRAAPHLACEPFDRLLQLDDSADDRLLRAYVRENDADPR